MSKIIRNRNTEQAINDFISVHGCRYDYSKFIYTKSKEKGIISCGVHGEFLMSYEKHFKKKQNCPNCAHNKKQDTAGCIEMFIKKHGNRYDYSSVVYTGNRDKVKIICRVHGVFEQEPISHKNGRNCPDCSRIKSIVDWEDTLQAFFKAHGDYYKYDKDSYIKSEEKLRITCPIHGDFYQRASQHKLGKGCKKCNMYYGWGKKPYLSRASKYDNKSYLYICEMSNSEERFVKVGIAYDGFRLRYKARERKVYDINLLAEYRGDAELVWDLETQMLRSMHGYKHKPLIKFDGYSECITSIDKSVFECLDLLCYLGFLENNK